MRLFFCKINEIEQQMKNIQEYLTDSFKIEMEPKSPFIELSVEFSYFAKKITV